MVADILVELKAKQIDQTFTYLIPDHLKDNIQVGMRVLVPFNRQELEGFVLKIYPEVKQEYSLKTIISLIDLEPILNAELLELGKYISKKTLSNLISCYQAMLPSALKAKHGFMVPKKFDTYLELINNNYQPTSPKQQTIIDLLMGGRLLKKDLVDISPSSLKTLIKNQVIKEIKEEAYRLDNDSEKEVSTLILNKEQNAAIKHILSNLNTFAPTLLYGVTGSGKTEVYMQIINHVLNKKQEVIVLVPEISLTPQLVGSFKRRFGTNIAIIHSRLSDGEKYDEWRKIERGEVSIVIGARSAIFAPFTKLGLIIIDEEHSQTYKQENNPKYNTIDIALWRAKRYQIPLILGSATPSIESFTRAEAGIYQLLKMEDRVNHDLPKVMLIDMKEEIRHNHKILSRLLVEKITDRLNKKEQIILLLNRRGYSTVITCHNCGFTDKCPNCDIPLTYHKTSNNMRCHYCGYGRRRLEVCPSCKSLDINEFGMGTQRLEEYIGKTFPTSRVIRMDMDTTSKKGSHEMIIDSFRNLEFDILIGTQMISKGLDFPKVTLVGVLNGDATLNIPDFRSAERTFQLLNQVAGRSGRGDISGEVIIQSYNIDHYSILKASTHDYVGFYNEELKIRQVLKYPPYYNLCLIKIMSKDYDLANLEANKIYTYFKEELNRDNIILGPSSSNMPKLNNTYYLQIIIKFKKTDSIINALNFINDRYRTNSKVHVDIDLNPIRL